MAFEVSDEDVLNVINNVFKRTFSLEDAEKIKNDFLDLRKVNKIAFYGQVLEEQEIYAYEEIYSQIEENKNKISLIFNINNF